MKFKDYSTRSAAQRAANRLNEKSNYETMYVVGFAQSTFADEGTWFVEDLNETPIDKFVWKPSVPQGYRPS